MLDFILLDISRGWKTGIMLVVMIAIFYFFLIRPQSQKAKEERQYRSSLQKGDKVMTANGIHATIVSVNGNQATIEVAQGVNMKVMLSSLNPIPQPKQS
ncbi:MAG: preprotein translocase subunit YajC [Bacteroidales bacterium]|nr:preprotein translocase subunit YajC [Bacteroidales bacterium]